MHRRILAGVLFCMAASSQAALLGRAPLTSGGTDYQAYYDTVLNITWLADADFAQTSAFDADGLMRWTTANGAWPASLNAASYLGTNAWRLPTVTEYSALFSQSLVTSASPGPFSNLQTSYWSSTAYRCLVQTECADGGGYWSESFNLSTGAASSPSPLSELSVWAALGGDIAPVPIPAALWLFGGALGALGWVKRRQATA